MVEVEVKWENFQCHYAFRPLKKEEVLPRIHAIMEGAMKSAERVVSTLRVPVRLREEEISHFGPGAIQIESYNAILIKAGDLMHKIPLWSQYVASLKSVWGKDLCPYIILESTVGGVRVFTYPYVKHSPLKVHEATKCLVSYRSFYRSLSNAIEKLHRDLKIAHMDIRLENICFNELFDVVFIDVDRCSEIVGKPVRFTFCNSCMYNAARAPAEHDWMQLGWLVAWVLVGGKGQYHGRKFTDLPGLMRKNQLLSVLICDGELSPINTKH